MIRLHVLRQFGGKTFTPGPRKALGGPDVRYSEVSLYTPDGVRQHVLIPETPGNRRAVGPSRFNTERHGVSVSANARGKRVGFPVSGDMCGRTTAECKFAHKAVNSIIIKYVSVGDKSNGPSKPPRRRRAV